MKSFCKFLLILIVLSLPKLVFAQSLSEIVNSANQQSESQSAFNAKFGYTQIDDVKYIGFRIQPEISIWKIGFGLDIPLLYDFENNRIRTEEFHGGVSYLRLINYVRYGRKKQDPIFVKVGVLNGAYLGFGILLNNYSNSISYEKRTVGLSFDLLFNEKYGIEGLYSDLNAKSLNLLALRPYYKPFGHLKIPIIRTLETGVSIVTDHDQTGLNSGNEQSNLLQSGMTGLAADVGMFLINTRFIDWSIYAQYGRLLSNKELKENSGTFSGLSQTIIDNYGDGSGISVGTAARMRFIFNIFEVSARLERIWYQDNFIPQFFDVNYQINKDAKIAMIPLASSSQGIYGALQADLLTKIKVGGGLLIPDQIDEAHPASLFLSLDAPDLIPNTWIKGYYQRGNITDLKDVLKLDENAQADVIVAYKIFKVIVAGVDYRWTFVPTSDAGLQIDHQVMPYVGVHVPLDFSN